MEIFQNCNIPIRIKKVKHILFCFAQNCNENKTTNQFTVEIIYKLRENPSKTCQMSTFGEIIEPSSRATWEDWDDKESGNQYHEIKWQKPLPVLKEVEHFLLFEGKCLWNSLRFKKNAEEINSIREANLKLYKTSDTNDYICIIKDCDLLLCNQVVNLLKEIISKSKMIVTVQEKPLSEYQSIQTLESSYIIRKVTTTNMINLMENNVKKLEQPNIISGVSAGVFTLREHLNLSSTAVVIFIEYSQQHHIEELESLLQKINITDTAQLKPNVILNSNLYI